MPTPTILELKKSVTSSMAYEGAITIEVETDEEVFETQLTEDQAKTVWALMEWRRQQDLKEKAA